MASEDGTWTKLVAATKNANLDQEDFRFVRWITVAPIELYDLPEVLRKLRAVLNAAESAWPGTLAQLEISPWPIGLLKLENEANKFSWPNVSEEDRHSKRGGATGNIRVRNPIYAALLAMPEQDSDYANSCRLLMAHAFLAHLRILRIPSGTTLEGGLIKGDTSIVAYESYAGGQPWPALTISPRHIGLAFRALSSGENWTMNMIQKFPVNDPPDKFAKCAAFAVEPDSLGKGPTTKQLEETRDCVLRYMAQAYGIKARHRGHGSTKRTGPPPAAHSEGNPPAAKTVRPPALPPTQNPLENCSEGGKGKSQQKDGDDEDSCARFDICPGEDDDWDDIDDEYDGEIVEGSSPSKTPQGSHAHKNRKSAKRRPGNAAGDGTNQAIQASKFLPCDKNRLGPSELVPLDIDARNRFANIMAELAESHHESDREHDAIWLERHQAMIIEAELILFALVMLWTASDIQRTKDLLLSGSPEYKGDQPLVVHRSPDHEGDDMIRIRTEWPLDAPRREAIPLDRVRTRDVRLHDAAGVGRLLRQFCLTVPYGEPKLDTQQVFLRPIDFYVEHVLELLDRLDPTGRLTLARLQSYFYEELMSWSPRDASATTIITGDYRNTARVQMFYADRLEKQMQEIHTGTIVYARNSINLAAMPRGSASQTIAHLDFLSDFIRKPEVSVPFVPAPLGAVHIGINVCPTEIAMRRAVQQVKESLLEAASRYGNWNELVNLSTFYSVWFFGFVSGSRAIECPYLWLHEVDVINRTARYQDKGENKARLVWIPEGLLLQMKHYESFLRGTRLGKLTEYPCWLVDETGQALVVKPSTLERHLHRFLPGFPSNIARRWMMNALLDSGCRVVPEWSGQARAGNQLTGPSGTSSPHQIGVELRRHLDPIIDFLDFNPVEARIV